MPALQLTLSNLSSRQSLKTSNHGLKQLAAREEVLIADAAQPRRPAISLLEMSDSPVSNNSSMSLSCCSSRTFTACSSSASSPAAIPVEQNEALTRINRYEKLFRRHESNPLPSGMARHAQRRSRKTLRGAAESSRSGRQTESPALPAGLLLSALARGVPKLEVTYRDFKLGRTSAGLPPCVHGTIGELEMHVNRHDHDIGQLIDAIRESVAPPEQAPRQIGFRPNNK